jgi:heat shock protein HslJ
MKKLITGLMLIILLIVSLSCNTAETGSGMGSVEASPTHDEEYALRRDAEIYAELEGVSVDEAIRRFELMDDAGPLQAVIVENEEAYAGSWIQHQPEYKIVFAFKENGEEIIRKYVKEDSPLAGNIKILTFKYSYRELEEIRDKTIADMQNLGIYPDSGIDMKNNCVYFSVTDKVVVDEAIRSGRLEIYDCVNVSQIAGLEISYDGESDFPELLTWSQWWAVSINGNDITGSRYISLYLSYDRRATGNAGCNYYMGRYVVKGSFIRFTGGTWSVMGCDEEILVQEDIYIDCLNNADTYSIEGNTMTIYDSSGQAILVFEKRPDYPMNPEDLIGTGWRLYQVDGEAVSENESGTLVFDEDGVSLRGLDSVTKYEYSYEARGDDIVFTSTKVERNREPSGEFAHGRPSAISYISPIISYRLIDNRLEMYTERRITLVFKPLNNTMNLNTK